MKNKLSFSIYAEFRNPTEAEHKIADIEWMAFNSANDVILGCDKDPNPAVVKIIVSTLETGHIHNLAREIQAQRITYEFREIFPASP